MEKNYYETSINFIGYTCRQGTNPDCPRDGPRLSHRTNPDHNEDDSGILDRANEDWRCRNTGTHWNAGTGHNDHQGLPKMVDIFLCFSEFQFFTFFLV
ncbi:unnamed protein product [Caretta caretta]